MTHALPKIDPASPLYNPDGLPLAASLLLLDDKGDILVVTRRASEQTNLPGGKRDAGETPLDNALRETFEETGLTVDPAACRALLSGECEPDPTSPLAQPYWVDCFAARYQGSFGEPRMMEERIVPRWSSPAHFVSQSAFPIYNQKLIEALPG